MKEGIHPKYPNATITCACGAVYETRSTRGSFPVEVCANCHPFYTGKQKLLDTKGRVDKFRRKYEAKAAKLSTHVPATKPPTPTRRRVVCAFCVLRSSRSQSTDRLR